MAQVYVQRAIAEHDGKQPLTRDALGDLSDDEKKFLNGKLVENTSLIKSVGDEYLNKVQDTVYRGVSQGLSTKEMRQEIQATTGVSQRRANLIARDQTGKAYGALNRFKQMDAGINNFTWSTAEDERVRPAHRELDGKIFSWADGWAGVYPGDPIQCRCTANAIFDDEAAAAPDDDFWNPDAPDAVMPNKSNGNPNPPKVEPKAAEKPDEPYWANLENKPEWLKASGAKMNLPVEQEKTQIATGRTLNLPSNQPAPTTPTATPPKNENPNYSKLTTGNLVNSDEIEAIKDYYHGDTAYGINYALRSGDITPDDQAEIDKIDKVLNANVTKKALTVFRKVNSDDFPSLKVGDVYEEKAFMSTAATDKGDRFTTELEGNIELRISVPKGTHGLDLKPMADKELAEGYDSEDEILLRRGLKQEIKAISYKELYGDRVLNEEEYNRFLTQHKITKSSFVKIIDSEIVPEESAKISQISGLSSEKNGIIKTNNDTFVPNSNPRSLEESKEYLKNKSGIDYQDWYLSNQHITRVVKFDPRLISESTDFIDWFNSKYSDFMRVNVTPLPKISAYGGYTGKKKRAIASTWKDSTYVTQAITLNHNYYKS